MELLARAAATDCSQRELAGVVAKAWQQGAVLPQAAAAGKDGRSGLLARKDGSVCWQVLPPGTAGQVLQSQAHTPTCRGEHPWWNRWNASLDQTWLVCATTSRIRPPRSSKELCVQTPGRSPTILDIERKHLLTTLAMKQFSKNRTWICIPFIISMPPRRDESPN